MPKVPKVVEEQQVLKELKVVVLGLREPKVLKVVQEHKEHQEV